MKGDWLRRPKGEAGSSVVIFVHGILSNDQDCWRHHNGCYWPELLSKHTKLSDIGIYVFKYLTNVFSGKYNLDDAVDSLREQLILDDVLNSGRVIFVCHSMGGIVVRK